MPKKNKKDGKPKVHEELEGFELKINEFGQIVSNMDPDEMNKFLNKHVDDKKLRDRDDLEEEKLEEEEEVEIDDSELPNFDGIEQMLDKEDDE